MDDIGEDLPTGVLFVLHNRMTLLVDEVTCCDFLSRAGHTSEDCGNPTPQFGVLMQFVAGQPRDLPFIGLILRCQRMFPALI